jgi:hypothetical protein
MYIEMYIWIRKHNQLIRKENIVRKDGPLLVLSSGNSNVHLYKRFKSIKQYNILTIYHKVKSVQNKI